VTLVIAHRGASAAELENTLAAFRTAVAMGADGVELDVHVSADGIPVVHHDPHVNALAIAETPLDPLRTVVLANGERIPTLAEALDVLGPSLRVYVELKALPEAHDAGVLEAMAAGQAPTNYQVHSFDHRIVRRLRGAKPDLKCGLLSCSYPIRPFVPLLDARAGVLWQQESLVDKQLIDEGHGLGLQVFAWAVDDPVRMKALVDIGTDAICTNRPDVAREVTG
jgi:glycerophosphoryl diester phosphodiesterase